MTASDTRGLRVDGELLPEPVVGTTQVGSHSASWLSWGDAARPTIVLLHGGAAHAWWWWFTAALLQDDFHVIALDLSGHGSSGWRPQYTYAGWVEEVLAVALPDERARPVVVGHSMVGMVAGVAAGHHEARRFAGIVVVDAPVVALGDESYLRSEEQFSTTRSYPDRESAVAAFRLHPPQSLVVDDFFDLVARRSVRRDETNGSWTWRYDPRAFTAKEDRPTTTVPQLGQAPCPVMAVVGERSSVVTAEDLAALRDLELASEGNVALHVLPGAAHHPMFDAPWALADIIRACAVRWTVAVDPA
jgi:pimeloyl-ACP methyl ester carboxylesterase